MFIIRLILNQRNGWSNLLYADIGVTLNTYTHLGFDDASKEMTRIIQNGDNSGKISNNDTIKIFPKINTQAANG